jgi:F420-dependent oxidoreductase-like protein
VRFGIHVVSFALPGAPSSLASTLAETARIADHGGAAAFTLMDHWFQFEAIAPATDPMLECYTTLGFLAGQTRRIRLGALVTGVTYRHPGLLAKTVASLDVLSGGRAQLGIGTGGYEREHRGLGVPLPPLAERFERLEETLQICRQMWSDDDGPFDGRHYRLEETICSPRPISLPRPPILVGGGGERRTLRLVARYADACNLFASSPEEIAHKLAVLDRHCDAERRDPTSIDRTLLVRANPLVDPDGFVADMQRVASLGVSMVNVMPAGDPVAFTTEMVERIAPRLADIGP